MTPRRFFATVWRINAIVVLFVGVLASVALVASGVFLYLEVNRPRYADDVARLAVDSDTIASRANIGNFEALPKTAVLRAPLRFMQSYSRGSISKNTSSIRNYLFYDPNARTSRWLKPSMDSLVTQTWAVPEAESEETRKDWVSSVYAIVGKDSNGDGLLSDEDQIQIASSNPDGTGFRVLVENVDRVHAVRWLADDRILVLYALGEKLLAVEFDPTNHQAFTKPHQVELPKAR